MPIPIVQLSNDAPVANDVSAGTDEDAPIVVAASYTDPDTADTHTFTAGVYSGPGFESGSFSGWTLSQDDLAFIPSNSSPIGRRHAVILSGAGESVYTTLERTFELAAGETLTGFAEFIAGDELPSDDDGYLSIAMAGRDPTVLFSASVASVGDFGNSGWVPFEFLAPESGTYILQAGVRNVGDNEDPSQFRLDMPDILTAVPWVTSNGDGTFNYDPRGRFEWLPEGVTTFDEFAYTVVDNHGVASSAFVEVEILGANDPAVTANDTASVEEDGVLSAGGNVLTNDSDIDLETVLTVAAPGVFNSAYGTLILDGDGSFSYTLNNASSAVQSLAQGQEAFDVFGYEASDGIAVAGATVAMNITGTNDAPVANDVSAEANEDGPPIVVAASYTDPDTADTHTFTAGVYSGPGFESGSFSGWTLSQDDLAFIPSNSSPIGRRHAVILSGAGESVYTTLERTFELAAGETLTGFAEFIAGDELPSDDDGYLSIAMAGRDPTVLFSASVASVGDFGNSGWVPFEFLAPESGTYILQAGVRNVGDNEDPSQFRLDMPDILTAVPWVTSNGDGTFNYDPRGRFEWLPEGVTTFDEFAYTVVDNHGVASSAFVEVEILGANDPAVTANDTASVEEDGVLSAGGNVLTNDSDIDLETVLTVAAPGVFNSAYGTLILDGDGSFSYTLNNASSAVQSLGFGQNVIDPFGYEATDGFEAVPGILNVVIAGANDAPVANLDTASVREDIVLTASGNVLSNDTDLDAGTLEVAAPGVFTGTYGTLTLAGSGGYSYVLNNGTALVQSLAEGQSVVDTFSYAATDGFTSTPSELRVTISGTNDAPETENDMAVVQEDTILAASGNVLANDTDIDQATELTVANAGTYGSLVLSLNGDYIYTLDNASAAAQALAAGQIETDMFTYVASDGIESTPGLLTVAVIGVNDLPVAQDDSGSVQEDGTLSAVGNALDNDADVDSGTILTVAAPGAFSGTYGTLSLAADGSFSYLLNNSSNAVQSLAVGQAVSDSFGYAASDGIAAAGATVTINIAGANDAPIVAVEIADQSSAAGSPFSFTVPDKTFFDIDNGDVLSYAATLADGSALPAWLVFDPVSRSFTGTPPGGDCDCECGDSSESLTIRVTAADRSSASVFDDFVLNVSGGSGEVGQHIIGTNGKDVLTGTACDDVIEGLKGDDRLTALAGNDLLDGGKGRDVMIGGTGDDTYIVDATADTVIEGAGGGYDIVFSSASYTLPANVEELVLTGFRDPSGIGNALDNRITGNAGDNRLAGGRGADVYVYELNGDDDVIEETGPEADTLLFGAGITPGMAKLERHRNDLIVELRGQHGSVTVKGWFASNSKKVESIQFADGTIWGVEEIRGRAWRKGHDGGTMTTVMGITIAATATDDYQGKSDGGKDDDHGHDRRGHDGDRVADSLAAYLADKPDYDFEALARDAERSDWRGEALNAEEIARRWRQVARYAAGLSHEQDDDARTGAVYRFDGQGLLGGGALGGGFGYTGSTGATRGAADMRTLEGLKEGFHPLPD